MATLQATDLLVVGRGAATYKATFQELSNSVPHAFVGLTPPATPAKGKLWLNQNNGVLYTFDGSVWVGK